MLTDQIKELLTAFVDGELSQRQRKAVARLLQRSSEAQTLVKQLQEDARKIKHLPRLKCEPSLVDDILQAITEQQPQSKQPRLTRRRWLPYVAAGLAASIMIGTAGLLYWNSPHDANPFAINPFAINKDKPEGRDPNPPIVAPTEKKSAPLPPRKEPNRLLANMIDETFGGFAAPIVEPKAFTASFSDLKKEDNGAAASMFTRELNRDRVVQLDITVKNNPLAMDHLRSVLKLRGINVSVDPSAGKSLAGKNQAKVEYLVYAENLTSDEVTRVMADLAQSMVKSGPKGNNQVTVESPFKQVAVAAIAPDDRQKLAKLLGVEPSAIEPKEGKEKPDPKRARSALVLPLSASNMPSAEVRQFVSQRRLQPGTVQVLIKIRQE